MSSGAWMLLHGRPLRGRDFKLQDLAATPRPGCISRGTLQPQRACPTPSAVFPQRPPAAFAAQKPCARHAPPPFRARQPHAGHDEPALPPGAHRPQHQHGRRRRRLLPKPRRGEGLRRAAQRSPVVPLPRPGAWGGLIRPRRALKTANRCPPRSRSCTKTSPLCTCTPSTGPRSCGPSYSRASWGRQTWWVGPACPNDL